MKNRMKNGLWLIVLGLISLNVRADSSIVPEKANYLTVWSMHLQEVVIKVDMDDLADAGATYVIRKSTDGRHYLPVNQWTFDHRMINQVVIADHLNAAGPVFYQLYEIDNRGRETLIDTVIFDPALEKHEETAPEGVSSEVIELVGDPHTS